VDGEFLENILWNSKRIINNIVSKVNLAVKRTILRISIEIPPKIIYVESI